LRDEKHDRKHQPPPGPRPHPGHRPFLSGHASARGPRRRERGEGGEEGLHHQHQRGRRDAARVPAPHRPERRAADRRLPEEERAVQDHRRSDAGAGDRREDVRGHQALHLSFG